MRTIRPQGLGQDESSTIEASQQHFDVLCDDCGRMLTENPDYNDDFEAELCEDCKDNEPGEPLTPPARTQASVLADIQRILR